MLEDSPQGLRICLQNLMVSFFQPMQLGNTKATKHSGGLLFTFIVTLGQIYHSGRKEATILIYGYRSAGVLFLTCLSVWCMLPLLAPNTRMNPCSKTWQQILLKFKLQGAQYYWEGILMCVLQHYQIPLTLVTFMNCYKHLNLLRLSNQALWLCDKIVMLVLAIRATSSWTYAVMLGCSSSMVGHLATN